MRIDPACAALLVAGLLVALPARAQVVDTLAAPPPDSALVVADSLPAPAPRRALDLSTLVAFATDAAGVTVNDSLPARLPDRELADVLAQAGGSFLYDFGGPGWPDGWSPLGLDPRQAGLQFQGISYADPVTGRPLYEMLPLPWLDPVRLQPGRLGQAMSVGARLRAYDAARPISELRYGSSKDGLQSAFVVHAQRRRVRFFREPGLFSYALGYGGHGANGEYPGSKLSAGRQLLARLRLQQSFGSLEIVNLQNRQRLGAHGGVIPFGTNYNSIYNRISAQVANATAKRTVIRNDLAATLRTRLLPGFRQPFEATGYWTAQTFRYALGSDTLAAATRRLGYRLRQPLIDAGPFSLEARAEGWRERVAESTALPDSLGLSRRAFHAGGRVQYRTGGFDLEGEADLHAGATGAAYPGGMARLGWRPGDALMLFAEASRSGQSLAWIDEYGWSGLVAPLAADPESRTSAGRAGVRVRLGPFDLEVAPFAHQTKNAFDLFTVGESDTLAVRVLGEPVRWVGASLDAGFRRDAARGFYLTAQPTVYRYAGDAASSDARRVQASLPELFVRGRSGLRYLLFKGDLDMDLYVQGRFWSPFGSRTLHPETGLLALPAVAGRDVLSSFTADIVLEAGVRTAKLYVAYDNVFSGTNVVIGNLLVPDYPLPTQRFRFGVFWPIFD
ncbi:MAG: putative porin [Rhodothermales bacterium]